MKLQWIIPLVCLICLVLATALSAQEDESPLPVAREKTVRLYSKGLPPEVDVQAFVATGQVMLVSGTEAMPSKVFVGPAPAPYPEALIWEKEIEQLGPSSIECDGMWFINGNLWQPHKIALVLWKIKIPNASHRLASEFERDLTLSLWVDSNEDKAWGKSEQVFGESFNIGGWFPNNWPCLNIWYLCCFRIPSVSTFDANCAAGVTKYVTKLWARGAISYDDADVSPAGQFLFGEAEDYRFNYFEIRYPEKQRG